MPTLDQSHLQSSVLLVSDQSLAGSRFGFDWIPPNKSAIKALSGLQHDVIVLPLSLLMTNEARHEIFLARQKKPFLQIVLLDEPQVARDHLIEIHNQFQICEVLPNMDLVPFENSLVRALEISQSMKQDFELENLIETQNERLNELYRDLEDRVEKRQRSLEESRRKTAVASLRWQLLREATTSIHEALSVGEIEKKLNEVLAGPLALSALRIFFKPQDQIFSQQLRSNSSVTSFQSPLFREQQALGSAFFLRDGGRPYLKEETDFLLRISDTISLSLDRLGHLQQAETLREQWQATFNAIKDPLVLIDENFEVRQANSSARARQKSDSKYCYQMLFQRESPCLGCERGQNFRMESRSEILDITSQRLDQLYFHIYHDISDQVRMERKILETARMAELGTIGSSIAHELNNPLGGVLSFVQLIQMDLKKDDPIAADLAEMEAGVKRCRDIIENLLGFTRNPDVDQVIEFDLREAFNRSFKIIDLQIKTKNIEIKTRFPKTSAPVIGHLNLLSQALKNLLQLSIDSILEKSQSQQAFAGVIEAEILSKDNEWRVEIIDNGPGQGRRNSLQYSISSQIIHEHGGALELITQPRRMTQAKFSLPKP